MRQKPLPLNPMTTGQYGIRQAMREIQKEWQDLTSAERLQWDRFLDYSGQGTNNNKSVKLSGHALFIKYQILRLITGRPILTTIAYNVMPWTPPIEYIKNIAGSLVLYLLSVVDSSEYWFIFRITSPRIANVAYSPRGLRVMVCTYGDSANYYFQTQYIAAFGAVPAIGDTVHYSIQWFSYTAPVMSGVITGTTVILAP